MEVQTPRLKMHWDDFFFIYGNYQQDDHNLSISFFVIITKQFWYLYAIKQYIFTLTCKI